MARILSLSLDGHTVEVDFESCQDLTYEQLSSRALKPAMTQLLFSHQHPTVEVMRAMEKFEGE